MIFYIPSYSEYIKTFSVDTCTFAVLTLYLICILYSYSILLLYASILYSILNSDIILLLYSPYSMLLLSSLTLYSYSTLYILYSYSYSYSYSTLYSILLLYTLTLYYLTFIYSPSLTYSLLILYLSSTYPLLLSLLSPHLTLSCSSFPSPDPLPSSHHPPQPISASNTHRQCAQPKVLAATRQGCWAGYLAGCLTGWAAADFVCATTTQDFPLQREASSK